MFERSNLRLKVEKCVSLETNLPYLGHIIDKNGIKLYPDKGQVIQEMRLPTTVTEERQFAGLCGC